MENGTMVGRRRVCEQRPGAGMNAPITDKQVKETVRTIVDNCIEEKAQGWAAAKPPEVRPIVLRAQEVLKEFNLNLTYREVEKEVRRQIKDRGE